MAYYKGNFDGQKAYCSGRRGSVQVNMSAQNSELALVRGRSGKVYSVWLNEGDNGGWSGTRMFNRVAVRVAVDQRQTMHVWVRAFAKRPINRMSGRLKRDGSGYTGSIGPMPPTNWR